MSNQPWLEKLKNLIKVLTPSQKRDFKKASRFWGGESLVYMKLFDALNDDLKKGDLPLGYLARLEQQGVVKKGDFSAVAGFLHRKILDNLRSSPDSFSGKSKLSSYLTEAQFLANKNLFQEGFELIAKARQLLRNYDYPFIALDYCQFERDLLHRSASPNLVQKLKELHEEERNILSRLQFDHTLITYYVEIQGCIQHNQCLSPESNLALLALCEQWLEGDPLYPFQTQRRIYALLALFASLPDRLLPQSDLERNILRHPLEFEFCRRLIHLYVRYPLAKKEDPDLYLQNLDRFLSLALREGKVEFFNDFEDDLQDYVNSEYADYYRSIVYLYLLRYLKEGSFIKAKAFLNSARIYHRIDGFKEQMTNVRYLTICYACAQVEMGLNQPELCKQWLDKIIRHKEKDAWIDLKCIAQCLYILAEIDQGIYQVHRNPDGTINSLRKWMLQSKLNEPVHQAFLLLLGKTLKDTEFSNKQEIEKHLHLFQSSISSAPKHHAFQFIEIWYKARIKNLPIEKIIKEEYSEKA